MMMIPLLRLAAVGFALSIGFIPSPVRAGAADDAVMKRGRVLSLRCSTCHEYAAGKAHKVGPNLHGFFGRRAGAAPGFDFSPAMSASTRVWNEATIDQWLERPSAVIPGTKMAFVGLPKPDDRRALIAWLREATR